MAEQQVVRDLVFKVTLKKDFTGLTSANKQIDTMRKRMIDIQSQVEKSLGGFKKFSTKNARGELTAFKEDIKDIKKEFRKPLYPGVRGGQKGSPMIGGVDSGKPLASSTAKVAKNTKATKSNLMGTVRAIGMAVATARILLSVNRKMNESIVQYKESMDSTIRLEQFYTNALMYRQKNMNETWVSGAKYRKDYVAGAKELAQANMKNADSVAEQGVVSSRTLKGLMGQIASFQINPQMWFGGSKGKANLETLADFMTSIYGADVSQSQMINSANMIGKAVTLGNFGQLQR